MKPNTFDITIEGTPSENKVKMSFDEDAMGHLMAKLTDMYSDRVGAVVREPATNAWDSHQRAGNPAPIEVTLPTTLDPVYVVRDRGTGMSVDTVHSVFGKYGGSTKRHDDVESGYMGLGCKAPLTYTNQYTLITRKDGIEATVEVTRDESDGGGAIEVIDTCSTDEPDGTEVLIPVSNVWEFTAKAKRFFRFWEPGSVLVDGKPPSEPWEQYDHKLDLDPDVLVIDSIDLDGDYIVQGNIPYPVSYEYRLFPPGSSLSAIVRVPMGAVAFTPNREALDYTRPTVELLDMLRELVAERLPHAAVKVVAEAKDIAQAQERANHWRMVLGDSKYPFIWKGRVLPTRDLRVACHEWEMPWDGKDTSTPASRMQYLAWRVLTSNYVHVLGFGGAALRKDIKQKCLQWAEEHYPGSAGFVFYKDRPAVAKWRTSDTVTVDYEVIKAIQVATSRSSSKPVVRTQRIVREHGMVRSVPESDLAIYKRMYFFSPTQADISRLRNYSDAFAGDGVAVLIINKNEWKRFQRDFPKAMHIKDGLPREVKRFFSRMTPDARASLMQARTLRNFRLSALPPDVIEDPDLKQMLLSIQGVKPERQKRYDALAALCANFRVAIPGAADAADLRKRMQEKSEEYRIVSNYLDDRYYPDKEHMKLAVEAVNALYKTRQEQS